MLWPIPFNKGLPPARKHHRMLRRDRYHLCEHLGIMTSGLGETDTNSVYLYWKCLEENIDLHRMWPGCHTGKVLLYTRSRDAELWLCWESDLGKSNQAGPVPMRYCSISIDRRNQESLRLYLIGRNDAWIRKCPPLPEGEHKCPHTNKLKMSVPSSIVIV